MGERVKGTVRASRTRKRVCVHTRFKDKNEERKRGEEKPASELVWESKLRSISKCLYVGPQRAMSDLIKERTVPWHVFG